MHKEEAKYSLRSAHLYSTYSHSAVQSALPRHSILFINYPASGHCVGEDSRIAWEHSLQIKDNTL